MKGKKTSQLRLFIDHVMKEYLSGLSVTDNTDYSLWKATRHIKRPRVHVLSIQKEGGIWARSEQGKTEIYICSKP